jgi:hypothetical protein
MAVAEKMRMQVHCSGCSCMHSEDGYTVKKCARMIVVLSEISKSMFGCARIWWRWWYKVSDKSPASEIVDGDIIDGGRSLDGIGFAAHCSVIGCWRWSIITIVKVDLRQRRFINNSRCNTSLAVIVHNNKPQEDGSTEISRMNIIKKRGDNRSNSNSCIRLFIKVLWPNQ